MKRFVLLWLFAGSITFGEVIPSLTIDGETYKNVELGSVSGSKVTLFYDGGGKQFPISKLPSEIQQRLHYDPEAAEKQDAADAARKAASRAAIQKQLQDAATAKATLGPSQTIRIVKVLSDTQFQIVSTNGVQSYSYIHGLPPEIITFIRDLSQTQASVNANQGMSANATYTRQVGSGKYAGAISTGQLTDAAVTVAAQRKHLADLQRENLHGEKTTIIACPTAYYLSASVRQWEFKGMALFNMAQ